MSRGNCARELGPRCDLVQSPTEISWSDMERRGGEIRESITGKEKEPIGCRRIYRRRFHYRQVPRSAYVTSDAQKVSRSD